ncbi:MAG: hypothetical protein MST10_03160 [Lentisphaeria bacterium]|nr:hypothetical protein [Lentisphaeria bacterium]
MRFLLIGCCILLLFFGAALPSRQSEAQAFDPVTIAILTPVALKVAAAMRPYVMEGLRTGTRHMISMGKDMFELFLLPWGALQATVGLPFGGLGPGIKNVVRGFVAPFKLGIKAVLLPIAFMGVSV